jgi:hypothetical protein
VITVTFQFPGDKPMNIDLTTRDAALQQILTIVNMVLDKAFAGETAKFVIEVKR